MAAVRKLIEDLRSGGAIRAGMGVRHVEGTSGIYEMRWAPDGRATFQYGNEIRAGEAHIVWRRVGSHAVYKRP